MLKITNIDINKLKPYKNNPRKNDGAVEYVANSIKEFGFKVPIIVDKDYEIIAGHTRLKAAQKLGLKEVPCIIADDLTEEQVKAFRLADNKVSEIAEWDFNLLDNELSNILDIDMSDFGFVLHDDIDWASVEDLSEETYEAPVKDMLECPHCHHIDSKNNFKKVDRVEEYEKLSDEE
jgi:ParB family chromosome partitioning protein